MPFKPCPICNKEVRQQDTRCWNCDYDFEGKPPEGKPKGAVAGGCLLLLLLIGLASFCAKGENTAENGIEATANSGSLNREDERSSDRPAPTNEQTAEPADRAKPEQNSPGSVETRFTSLCLLNPADGTALLPGMTVAEFVRQGRTSGRLKRVSTEATGDSGGTLRFLAIEQGAPRLAWVSFQFIEVEPRPKCEGRRAAKLVSASFNGLPVSGGAALVRPLNIMYFVVQDELNAHLNAPESETGGNSPPDFH